MLAPVFDLLRIADGGDAAQECVVHAARRFARLVRDHEVAPAEFIDQFSVLDEMVWGATRPREIDAAPTDASVTTRRQHPDVNSVLARFYAATVVALAEESTRERRELAGMLDVFTRTMSHELKNPIGAASGGAQMLLDDAIGADPAQRRRFAELITRNLARAHDLVNDLRALIATRTGADSAARLLPLRRIVDDVFYEVRGAADDKGVQLTVIEPFPEPTVDARRVSLVLMNLVWNAVKYADSAKPARWVHVEAHRADGGWQCSVADNGLGIPEHERDRVFDRFHRVHRDAATGSGLGLTITREAVQQLGGRLWLESAEGAGSTFSFTIPDAQLDDARRANPAAAAEPR